MGAVVPFRSAALTRSDARRLALFTKTVGKDLVGAEIDEALEWCELYQANPFTRDIYFFAFGKPGTDKRKVVPVISVGHYRKIAAKSGNYRPDPNPPRFRYDEALKSSINPTGMVDCEVSVYRYAHGEWHPITSRVRWEERAPIKEVWDNGVPTGRFELDPKKQNWRTMPETMLGKCVEVDAIRKGWPNETAGSYCPEEMDAAHTIELTATEIIAKQETTERLSRLGDGPALLVQWGPADALERVPVGKFGDRVLDYIAAHMVKGGEEPGAVMEWASRNRVALTEYWAHDKNGALAVKAKLEQVQAFAAQPMAAE